MVIKSGSNPLNAEKLYLSNTAVTFNLSLDTRKHNYAFLLNYLDKYIPASEDYLEDDLVKEKLGLTYRFDKANVLESDCTIAVTDGCIWLDPDVDYIYHLEKTNQMEKEELDYLRYLLKVGYTVDLIADGGIYKFYDRLHDKICLVDGEVKLEIRIVPK